MKNLKTFDKNEGKTTPSFTPTPTFCTYCGKAHNPPTTKLNFCSPQAQETKCIELYRQVNTMDFTTFHQLFDTTLHTMQLTNLTNTDLLALHPDFLRRVMSQALVENHHKYIKYFTFHT